MEVPPVGIGASGVERGLTNPVVPPANFTPAFDRTLPVTGDSIAALLSELSQADLTRLLQIVDAPLQAVDISRGDDLLRTAADAVAAQNVSQALDLLRQFAKLDPARAETLPSLPWLASIRPNLEHLLSQVTGIAKLHAEDKLAEATQKLEISSFKYSGELRPEIFLLVATNHAEAGGLANYVRSASVSAALLDQSRWAPAMDPAPTVAPPPTTGWYVDLRLLISIWITLGILSIGSCWWLGNEYLSVICEIWAAGLVLLIIARVWLRPTRS